MINDEDRTILGNPNPNWFFSLSNNLSYKGWELSVFLQGVAGNKIYNANNVDNEGMAAAYNQTTAVLNRWTGRHKLLHAACHLGRPEPELPRIRPICGKRLVSPSEKYHPFVYTA